MNAIFKRRSIRKFIKEELPQEDVMQILKAGMAAPSAKDNRDWVFIFLEDAADIECFIEVHPNAFPMRTASVSILVCADKAKNKDPKNDNWGILNAAAGIENMLIMATELGYGSLWVGVYPEPRRIESITRLCALPEHIVPIGIVCVGKAGEEKEPIDRYQEDTVFHGKYGVK
jgi:nitroreductase